jgi:protein TonB
LKPEERGEMMEKHSTTMIDWKDVANSYMDKAFSLSILLFLFIVMVTPKIKIQPYQYENKQVQSIDIPPEMREKLKPPEDVVKPVFNVVIDDDLGGSSSDAIEVIETIDATKLDPMKVTVAAGMRDEGGTTPHFVIYEDPPDVISRVMPEYSAYARKIGLQGTVTLDVEVLEDGHVGAVQVKKSLDSTPGGLDESAMNAVRKWKFKPAMSGGKPIACWAFIPVEFSLSRQ